MNLITSVGDGWAISFIFRMFCKIKKFFITLMNILNINFFETLQYTLYIIQPIEIPLI